MSDKISVTGLGSFLAPNISTVVLQRSKITGDFQIVSIDGGFGHAEAKRPEFIVVDGYAPFREARPELVVNTEDAYVKSKLDDIAQKHADTKATMDRVISKINSKNRREQLELDFKPNTKGGILGQFKRATETRTFNNEEERQAVLNKVIEDSCKDIPGIKDILKQMDEDRKIRDAERKVLAEENQKKLEKIVEDHNEEADEPVIVASPEPVPEPELFEPKKRIDPFFLAALERSSADHKLKNRIKSEIEGAQKYNYIDEPVVVIPEEIEPDELRKTKRQIKSFSPDLQKKIGAKIVEGKHPDQAFAEISAEVAKDLKKPQEKKYNYVPRRQLQEDLDKAVIHYSHKYAKGNTKVYPTWNSFLWDRQFQNDGNGVVPVLDTLESVVATKAVPAVEVLFAKMIDDADYAIAKEEVKKAADIINNDPEFQAEQKKIQEEAAAKVAVVTKPTLVEKVKTTTISLLTKVKGFIWKK